jgi:HK97 family phage major capsid protein
MESKSAADALLEEKVARIDAGAGRRRRRRLDRALSRGAASGAGRRRGAGDPPLRPTMRKAAWDGYLKTGASLAAGCSKAKGLSEGVPNGRRLCRAARDRAADRAAAADVLADARHRHGADHRRRRVPQARQHGGRREGWVAETDARPETDPATLALLEFPSADLYASPAATQALLDDALDQSRRVAGGRVSRTPSPAQETEAFVNGNGTNKPKGFLSYDERG